MALQDHRASEKWAGGEGQPQGWGKAGWLPRGPKGGSWCKGPSFAQPLGRPEARLCMRLASKVPASPVT